MKNNKHKKKTVPQNDKEESLKSKKKVPNNIVKVNVKSKKFWEEIYDNEGDDIEKFIR